MICKVCQKNQYKEMLKEKDRAMKRYTDKIRKDKDGKQIKSKR